MSIKSVQPLSESRSWEKIAEANNLQSDTAIYFNRRRVVSRRDLRRLWNCTDEMIKRYVTKGMPNSELSLPNFVVYDLETVNEWRATNINSKRGGASTKARADAEAGFSYPATEELTEEGKKSHAVRQMIADADRAVESAQIAKLKRLTMEGALISAEDASKTLAEQAVIHVAQFMNDKKLLPVRLANKNPEEIRQLLDGHWAKHIADLNNLVTKEFDCDETLYDVVNPILELFLEGRTPEEVMYALTIFKP